MVLRHVLKGEDHLQRAGPPGRLPIPHMIRSHPGVQAKVIQGHHQVVLLRRPAWFPMEMGLRILFAIKIMSVIDVWMVFFEPDLYCLARSVWIYIVWSVELYAEELCDAFFFSS